MILYPDCPNINFVNSITEKDIVRSIPSDNSLNLLTSTKNKFEPNNKSKAKPIDKKINLSNIYRELINLLNYEIDIDQNLIQENKEKERKNVIQGDYKNNEIDIKRSKEQSDNLINENIENIQKENKNEIKKKINKKQNNYDNINEIESTKIIQPNSYMNSMNNLEKKRSVNENFGYNINQNIYNNFNIPHVNFIYNFGVSGTNNNCMNNINNINNVDINEPKNTNNFNNMFININPNIIPKYEKESVNINDNNKKDFLNNNQSIDNNIYNIINRNNNNNNYYIENNNNNNTNKKFKKIKKETKYMNMTLEEITNNLDLIASKKHGCKFLEDFLKSSENHSEIINNIFYPKLYWVKLCELCNDLFGNYFIQALIPELDYNNLISFTNLVVNNLLKLCLNSHGTRVVQILINNIKDNKFGLLLLFKKALSQIMVKLIYNLNGSFVIMHYAMTIKDNEMIYDFLNNNLVDIATNSYSCSALQKLIDISNNQQKQKLLINIVNNTNNLVGNQCGLYVLQFVMSKNNYYLNDAILGKILDKIIFLSKRKYSSNVIEKCLETCSREMVDKLIDIFNNEIIIRDLIKDIFGNYVIQKLLIVCYNEAKKEQILKYIALEFKNLKNLSYGQKLMNKIVLSFPQIRKYL